MPSSCSAHSTPPRVTGRDDTSLTRRDAIKASLAGGAVGALPLLGIPAPL
ncbi:twin-arginine translocation signal domain-containing protein, partial [Gemmatimonas sp.]